MAEVQQKLIADYVKELEITSMERWDFLDSLKKFRENDSRFHDNKIVKWDRKKIEQYALPLANTWLYKTGSGAEYWGPGKRQIAEDREHTNESGNDFEQQYVWPESAKQLQEMVAAILERQIWGKAKRLRAQRRKSQSFADKDTQKAPNIDRASSKRQKTDISENGGPVSSQKLYSGRAEGVIEICSSSEEESDDDEQDEHPRHCLRNQQRGPIRRSIEESNDLHDESLSRPAKRVRTDARDVYDMEDSDDAAAETEKAGSSQLPNPDRIIVNIPLLRSNNADRSVLSGSRAATRSTLPPTPSRTPSQTTTPSPSRSSGRTDRYTRNSSSRKGRSASFEFDWPNTSNQICESTVNGKTIDYLVSRLEETKKELQSIFRNSEASNTVTTNSMKDLMEQHGRNLKTAFEDQRQCIREMQKRQIEHQKEMRRDINQSYKDMNNTVNQGREDFLEFMETEFKSKFLGEFKAAMAQEFKEFKTLHEKQAKLLPVLRCRTHQKDWCYQCNLPDTARGRALANHVRRPPSRARRTPGPSVASVRPSGP